MATARSASPDHRRSRPSARPAWCRSASNYFLNPVGGGTGPELKFGGTPVVAGQFGGWTPIGAEQTGSGYEVAWKVAGQDQYTVWNTDTQRQLCRATRSASVSGSRCALEALETSFHQDLNGDGTIGISATTSIEAFGSTSLVQIGIELLPGSGRRRHRTGVEVWRRRRWSPGSSAAGRRSARSRPAAATRSPGRVPGQDQYTVWNTDSSGNYVAQRDRRGVGQPMRAGGAGDELPPGSQWRRHDRHFRHRDRGPRLDRPGAEWLELLPNSRRWRLRSAS